MYKVIKEFLEKNDNMYRYHVDDEYPREGAKASKKRLAELAGESNQYGIPFIIEEKDDSTLPSNDGQADDDNLDNDGNVKELNVLQDDVEKEPVKKGKAKEDK